MIAYTLDEEKRVLQLHPTSALQREDFEEIARTVDPFLEKEGKLDGLIIVSNDFPGWENLTAMLSHFRFIHDHHKKIGRVALVTDSRLGDVAERIGSHFVDAQVRHFPADQLDAADQWVSQSR